MAPELHMAFTSQPEYRSHEEITQILWVLRASKVFCDLFPDDMQYELARLAKNYCVLIDWLVGWVVD